jgi:hypothetical protein
VEVERKEGRNGEVWVDATTVSDDVSKNHARDKRMQVEICIAS